ncbi:aig family protein [Entamoeba histolytica]|uniref:Aig family protein n=1 Tax=Entamoeba histolytica TaxID=5759 RepID=A0A175K0Z2_ENTHI|nr:aig family protein [Entamoeba histolytica]
MSLQKPKQTKLLLIGETGTGKSSLGNSILQKDVFKVGNSTKSETDIPLKCFGEGDRSGVVVIDTPGFNDTNNFDNKHIQNIVNCVRVEGLQGIILTMEFANCKFTENVKQVIKTINDVFFKIKDIWKHVCIVWNKCYNYTPKEIFEKGKKEKEEFKKNIIEFINQINKTNECLDIPMYFIDSEPCKGYDNSRSENEIERLIEWGRGKELIDEEEIKKLISEYKEIRYEEKEEKGITIKETKSNLTYKINKYRREIKVKYNGEEIEGEWHLIDTKTVKEKKERKFIDKLLGVVKVVGVITLAGAVVTVTAGVGAGIVLGAAAIGAIGGATVGAACVSLGAAVTGTSVAALGHGAAVVALTTIGGATVIGTIAGAVEGITYTLPIAEGICDVVDGVVDAVDDEIF